MLALTFVNKDDYNKIKEKRYFYQSKGWNLFAPDKNLTIEIIHPDGSLESFEASHTYNNLQIEWFKAGSALNYLANKK